MKKFLTAFLCGAAVLLSAETLKEWKFEGDKIPGLTYPNQKIGIRVSPDVKTPDGAACGEFSVKVPGDAKVLWSLQICFNSNQKIVKGGKYRYTFQIRADRAARTAVTCSQGQRPWKAIGPSHRNLTLSTDWQNVSAEFVADMDYEGSLRSPMLMGGALPEGTVFWMGPVAFEQIDVRK